MVNNNHTWTDNPMKAGISPCEPDVVNENLMYLKETTDKNANGITNLGTSLTEAETNIGALTDKVNTLETKVTSLTTGQDTINNKLPVQNMYTTSDISTDTQGYNQLVEMKHSTFDKSKFTIVGNPTITDDGIASGFSSENYIKLPISLSEANSWEITLKNNSLYNNGYLLGGNILNTIAYIKGTFYISSNGTSWDVASNVGTQTDIPANSLIQLEFTGSKYISKYSTDNGLNWNITGELNSNVKITDKLNTLYVGVIINGEPTNCSIDLKQFSITVDGKEVFSGNKTGTDTVKIGNETVEIPYTQSKTGSKIVDVVYRDRVIDLYEQGGQARYYTIDELNKNFTLPMGEIYGMIGQGGGSGSGSGSGLEVGDIGMALYVNEADNLRRYLNGQIVDNNKNTKVFIEDYLLGLYATNPDYFTTEENWQAEALLNVDGCVYKFVLNYSGANVVSVRLPKYPDYVEVNAGGTLPVVGNGMALGMTDGTSTKYTYQAVSGNNLWSRQPGYLTSKQGKVGDTTNNVTEYLADYKFIGIATDPTKSGIETTLKQTKLKMRYFIQIATGSETEANIVNTLENVNGFTLLESKYSDKPLYNESWLLSNGQWNAKAVYPTVYEALQVEYNSQIEVGTTVTLPSGVSYTKRGLSAKLSTETYTDYDFVLNTADETFRLPLLNGDEHIADYTNSTTIGNNVDFIVPQNGFIRNFVTNVSGISYASVNGVAIIEHCSNASVYNDSDIVKVSKGDIYHSYFTSGSSVFYKAKGNGSLYFYVGDIDQNHGIVDMGRIGEQLAGKLDRSNKEEIIGWGMPDYSAGINISVPTQSAPYICQYDCYMQGLSYKENYYDVHAYINGTKYLLGAGNATNISQSNNIYLFLPKGTSIYFTDGYVSASSLYVFPLKGAN